MKLKLNINTKMLVYILTTSVLIFTLSVGYISFKTRTLALDNAEKLALNVIHENALKIEKELSEDLSSIRTLAQAFAVYDDLDIDIWQDLFQKMAFEVFSKNNHFFAFSSSWESQYFDSEWNGEPSRYFLHFERQENGEITEDSSIKDLSSEVYQNAKGASQDMIMDPDIDTEFKTMMSYIASPIYKNDNFAGYVVADIASTRFERIITNISTWESTEAYLTGNSGQLLWHSDEHFLGKTIIDYNPEFDTQFKLLDYIKNGESGIFRGVDKDNNKIIVAVAPIQVGEYKSPWALTLVIPINVVLKEANQTQIISLIIAFIGILIISIIIFNISRNMSSALIQTTDILEELSKGNTEGIDNLNINRGDEIEDMSNSVNALKSGLKETSVFAEQIGKGNLDAEFKPLSEKDILGNALLEMRKSLQHAEAEEKKRKIEDEKQNWATQGQAKFGEILRTNSNNIDQLSFNIMSHLINYLNINQGALFIIEDTQQDEKFLELKSAIAYDRDKAINKRIAVGDELIGRCAFEKKTIYITDIPQNYINITSGMGTANPTALLLVPLILNDDIFGVIEIASFHTIEDFQIEFVERLGESIASTIASVKVNETTTTLLEQSKSQAEELAAQEEEMRQNLEELQATQEEAARREYEMSGIITALGTTAFTVEYDIDGTIIACNTKYAEILGIPQEQVIGQSHQEGYEFDAEKKANYDLFWGDLRRGISKKETNLIKHNNKELWIEETYSPIIDQNSNKPYKILKIGFDITEQKLKEIEFNEQGIPIKNETSLLNEYEEKITDLQNELKKAQEKIKSPKKSNSQQTKEIYKPKLIIPATGDNLLDWVSDLKLDISEMDDQHEQLIKLLNMVYAAFRNNKNKKEIKDNLKSFIDFASYHFGKEEQYFAQLGFEEAKEHTAEHQAFLKKIKQFQTDYNTNKVKFLDEIMNYIKEWLFIHITSFDSKYKELFKSNNL